MAVKQKGGEQKRWSLFRIAASLTLLFCVPLATAPLAWSTLSASAEQLDDRADLLEAFSEVAKLHVDEFQQHIDSQNAQLATALQESLSNSRRAGALDVDLAPEFFVIGSCRLAAEGVRKGVGQLSSLTLEGWDELYQNAGRLKVPAIHLSGSTSVSALVADVVDKVNRISQIQPVSALQRVDFGLPYRAHLPSFSAVDVCGAESCETGEDCTTSPVLRCWLTLRGSAAPNPLTISMNGAVVSWVDLDVFQWLRLQNQQLADRLAKVGSPRDLFESDWGQLSNALPVQLSETYRRRAQDVMEEVGKREQVGQYPALPSGSLFGPLWFGALLLLIPSAILGLEAFLMAMHKKHLTPAGVESWFAYMGYGLIPAGELKLAYYFASFAVLLLASAALAVLVWVGGHESGLLFSLMPVAPWVAGVGYALAAAILCKQMRSLFLHAKGLGG